MCFLQMYMYVSGTAEQLNCTTCRRNGVAENVPIGQKNIQPPALVVPDKLLLPPLHIKLGLMKSFVKAMDRTSPALVS